MTGDGFGKIYTTLREASISSARACVAADQLNIMRLVDEGRKHGFCEAEVDSARCPECLLVPAKE